MSGPDRPPRITAGPTRAAPTVPSAEAAGVSAAVRDGLAAAAGTPGPSLHVGRLRVKVPQGADPAEVARAVQAAVEAARRGGRP